MSEILGRFAGFDLGPAGLSLWLAVAAAALIVVLAFIRASSDGANGVIARVALLIIGAGASWAVLDSTTRSDIVAERRLLDARVHELLARAAAPGSALACLDALAGDTVETYCEKAVFQTPEATAAAVSYVSAQLTLLAAFSAHAKRLGAGVPAALGDIRRAVETDRFGLIARVLAIRDDCTPTACDAFALLNDPSRIAVNLTERTYDQVVARHAAEWSAIAAAAIAPVATPAPAASPAGAVSPDKAAGLFFPSAASIPPVNIMDAEPQVETTATAPSAAKQPPTPPRRPAASKSQPGGPAQAQPKAQPPVDLNTAARPPAAAPPQ